MLPHEVEAELNDGVLPAEITRRNKKRAIELGFSEIDAPKTYGGRQLPMESQVAIWEQLGRTTNALSWCFSEPQEWMFDACNEDQIQRYILPMMRGEKKDCYAITESGPGSDVAGLDATAEQRRRRLHSEWREVVCDQRQSRGLLLVPGLAFPTTMRMHCFSSIWEQRGIEITASPKFSHTYAAHHPTYKFTDVRVPARSVSVRPAMVCPTHAAGFDTSDL